MSESPPTRQSATSQFRTPEASMFQFYIHDVFGDDLEDLILLGRNLNDQLFSTAVELEVRTGVSQRLYHKNDNAFNEWTEHVLPSRTEVVLKSVARAFRDLTVGTQPFQNHAPWDTHRKVDFEISPKGQNIPIAMIQDKVYGRGDKHSHEPLGIRYEAFYNVLDGVITIFSCEWPFSEEERNAGGRYAPPDWENLSDVISVMWKRLHMPYNGSNIAKKLAVSTLRAKAISALQNGRELPDIQPGYIYSWLPAVIAENSQLSEHQRRITRYTIEEHMQSWLNYIMVSLKFSHNTVGIINRCLQGYVEFHGQYPCWGAHVTLDIGQWRFYALLASDIGQEIVSLLVRRKGLDDFGRKVIKSITIFSPDHVPDMTEEENHNYNNLAALLFEIVDHDEQLRVQAQDREIQYLYDLDYFATLPNIPISTPTRFSYT